MRPHKKSLFHAVVGPLLLACGSSESSSPAPQPPAPATREALTACATASWVGTDRACMCFGGSALDTSECGAPDCAETDVLVLRGDGTSFDLIQRRSVSRNTSSAVGDRGGVVTGKWEVSPERKLVQVFATRSYVTDLTCSGDVLVRPSKAKYKKASTEVESALTLASQSSWGTVSLRK